MGGYGWCPMCQTENTLLEEHHEYVLDKKNGKIIMMCNDCHKRFTQYFQYLKDQHNYEGSIRWVFIYYALDLCELHTQKV